MGVNLKVKRTRQQGVEGAQALRFRNKLDWQITEPGKIGYYQGVMCS